MSRAIPRAASSSWLSRFQEPRGPTVVNTAGLNTRPVRTAEIARCEAGPYELQLKRAVGVGERGDALPDFFITRRPDEVPFDNIAFIVQQIARIGSKLKVRNIQLLHRAHLRTEHRPAAMALPRRQEMFAETLEFQAAIDAASEAARAERPFRHSVIYPGRSYQQPRPAVAESFERTIRRQKRIAVRHQTVVSLAEPVGQFPHELPRIRRRSVHQKRSVLYLLPPSPNRHELHVVAVRMDPAASGHFRLCFGPRAQRADVRGVGLAAHFNPVRHHDGRAHRIEELLWIAGACSPLRRKAPD